MTVPTPPPHEDPTLPPQLREALGIMARRGPVVELVVGPDGTAVPKTAPAPAIPDDRSYTVDQLTRDDFTALCAFIDARLSEVTDRHPVDSGEARTARVLAEALSLHRDNVRISFQWEEMYDRPAPPSELSDRESAWNMLVCATWPGWHDVEGYDTKRWTLVHTPRRAPEESR